MPPVGRIAPAPITEILGQMCVDFARPPYTSLVQTRHHHSPARVSPLELQACGPVIEEQATAAFQRRTSALHRRGNLVPSGAVRFQGCRKQRRRDVETSPRAPCVVPSLQMVLIRQSGLSKQWNPLPSSLCDLSSKQATLSLASLLLGCLAQATLDCVLTTVVWQNLSTKRNEPDID